MIGWLRRLSTHRPWPVQAVDDDPLWVCHFSGVALMGRPFGHREWPARKCRVTLCKAHGLLDRIYVDDKLYIYRAYSLVEYPDGAAALAFTNGQDGFQVASTTPATTATIREAMAELGDQLAAA